MRHSFKDADFAALTELWNSFYPERFAIDADIFKLNTVESPVFDWGASFFEESDGKVDAFVIFKRSANPTLYGGPELDQAHLSAIAYKEPQIGLSLMAESKRVLRERGVSIVVFGQDSRHFFPGCPVEMTALHSFLTVEGFVDGSEPCDVERDLTGFIYKESMPEGVEVRRLNAAEHDPLEDFMGAEFPGRWRHDVMHKFRVEGPESVVGIFVGRVLMGFAMIQDWRQLEPVSGCVWRKSLGEHWGGLGPIGVSKKHRGQGLGTVLLGKSLQVLADEGVRNCIIDWTNLLDFYGKFGFKESRRYTSMTLMLDV